MINNFGQATKRQSFDLGLPIKPTRARVGIVILGLLALVLLGFHAAIGLHRENHPGSNFGPRLAPPQLKLQASIPTALIMGARQKIFHGMSSCVIASINGENFNTTAATIEAGTNIGMGGWLVDKPAQDVPSHAWIVLAGAKPQESYQSAITFHEKRPDVRESFGGAPGYTNSGFIADLSSTNLPIGEYHVYIVFSRGDAYYTCDNGRHVDIIDKQNKKSMTSE